MCVPVRRQGHVKQDWHYQLVLHFPVFSEAWRRPIYVVTDTPAVIGRRTRRRRSHLNKVEKFELYANEHVDGGAAQRADGRGTDVPESHNALRERRVRFDGPHSQ